MPYLLNIGPHSRTVCGIASRGYHIYRRGRFIVTEWGQVKTGPAGSKGVKVCWCYVKPKKYDGCVSEQMAKRELLKRMCALIKKGYRPMQRGTKILKHL